MEGHRDHGGAAQSEGRLPRTPGSTLPGGRPHRRGNANKADASEASSKNAPFVATPFSPFVASDRSVRSKARSPEQVASLLLLAMADSNRSVGDGLECSSRADLTSSCQNLCLAVDLVRVA